ncbi:MAG TPA: hypothetical protein DIC64_04895 [Alphaproteobacteria bacterium]|nr:hypothetical protein [Alphaproteobacteria bacterium]
MIEKMKNDYMKDFNMNRKTLLLACLSAIVSLSGCVMYRTSQPENNAVYMSADENACPQGVCETDPFINYTNTRADFREYGELSPRDHLVSQSGAGNNISASVPPTIESEVISYEEQVDQSLTPSDEAQTTEVVEIKEGETLPETLENTASEDNALSQDETVVAENDTTEAETNADVDEEDPVQDWYAEEGQNLKALLTKWSNDSGWRLVWNTNRNYVLNAGAMFRGRFADVSSALIRAFARARPAPIATFYKGNRVLVVETMEDENAYD